MCDDSRGNRNCDFVALVISSFLSLDFSLFRLSNISSEPTIPMKESHP